MAPEPSSEGHVPHPPSRRRLLWQLAGAAAAAAAIAVLFVLPAERGVDLTGARTVGTRMDEADLRGATVDASLWTTASLTRTRIDIEQALAYAAAHGLRLDGG